MPAKKHEVSQENNTVLDTTSRNLSFLMSKRGIDASAICKATGIAVATLNTLRRGEGNPTLTTLISIAQFFGISLTELTEIVLTDDIFKNTVVRSIPFISFNKVDDYFSKKIQPSETYTIELEDSTKNYIAVSLNNDTLLPIFERGTIFVISTSDKPTDGEIVLIKIEENLPCFRKIYLEDGHNLFMPVTLSKEATPSIYNHYKLLGVVIKSINIKIMSDK